MSATPAPEPMPPAAPAVGTSASAAVTDHHGPLRHLGPGWFAVVMGLCGLALAWHRATPLLGDAAAGAALVVGGLAALVGLLLFGLSAWRRWRMPEAWAEDMGHPVRHAFAAALPIALLLLATVAQALSLPRALVLPLWLVGSVWQFVLTLWVMGRWLRPAPAPGAGAGWAGVTPVLFIPIVGNVVVPLAGVPLGWDAWSLAQFAVGLLFWPLVLALLLARIAQTGLWPERMLPTTFITVAPPAVVGLSLLQFSAAPAWAWGCWGLALFFLLWSAQLMRRILAQPFALPFWGMSFPLAAFAALSLRLMADGGAGQRALALAALALASLVIAGLVLATLRGLRQGTLLLPEPAAPGGAAAVVVCAPR